MASTLTRKQREIAEREELILDVARDLLAERGYLGMNMDRVAEETEYSKGTVYAHFSSKEDLLMAVAIQTAKRRTDLFARASTFEGRPRERMTAVGAAIELFVAMHPEHFQAEQIVMAESIREKTASERQAALAEQEAACMGIVVGIVTDGIEAGDLVLPEGVDPAALCFGLWVMSYGGHSIIVGKPDLPALGIPVPDVSLRLNQHLLMDAHQWRPFTHAWDYAATRARIFKEVFPDEARKAGLV